MSQLPEISHRIVEHGKDDAAVGNTIKTDVFRPRSEATMTMVALDMELDLQANRVVGPTNKAIARIGSRKWFGHTMSP